MLTIHNIDALGQWTGVSREVEEHEGWDEAWTLAPLPPEAEPGQSAVWASNAWHLRDWIDPEAALAPAEDPLAEN
ncbi:hypothetical protein [Caulobacter segnis]|uniref:hypothetical protein n=1 Tax=Caulobacter segnis TaxID=88688 RepID=UPI001CC05E2B|nr:hypothetical protein [Caulobacter segnis]UAL09099.1 hypothetical protein K8940_15000 [Caulobacter segnis]